MHLLLQGTYWTACAVVGFAAAYLLLLTVASLFERVAPPRVKTARARFAVMVPAHNEESSIAGVLESLAALDYPPDGLAIFVVADNCSDSTASIARQHGVRVYERFDTEQRGKGHALRWLLQQIEETGERFDAFVIFDADSRVNPDFLRVMDAEMAACPGEVLQAHYGVLNPGDGMGAALRYAAMALVNYLRPLGRSALGYTTGLKGNGMCFPVVVMRRHGWGAYSLAEDAEHGVRLLLEGVHVRFVPAARVWAQMPPEVQESRSQNLRWEAGRLLVARNWAPQLLRESLKRGDTVFLEAAVDLLIPPLSTLAAGTLVLGALSILPPLRSGWWAPAAIGVALGTHVLVGLARVGAPRSVWRSLLHAPGYALWKLALYGTAMIRRPSEWVRTRRFP